MRINVIIFRFIGATETLNLYLKSVIVYTITNNAKPARNSEKPKMVSVELPDSTKHNPKRSKLHILFISHPKLKEKVYQLLHDTH